MLSKQQEKEIKNELLQRKKEIEVVIDHSDHFGQDDGFYHESSSELSSIDNHPADEGTELFEREKDIALNDHLEYQLTQINQALESIEKGNYGICRECGADIPYERLAAVPQTVYCIEHSKDKTIPETRPVEEEVLMPPYGKFVKDDEDENVAFDAEDTWQAVSVYGTSETPSDFLEPQDDYGEVIIDSAENDDYVEAYESFRAYDMEGNIVNVFPTEQQRQYERELDEAGTMTPFGDLPAYEHEPYTDND